MKSLLKLIFVITSIVLFSCQENKIVISQNEKKIQEVDSVQKELLHANKDIYENEIAFVIAKSEKLIKQFIKENKKVNNYTYTQKSKVTNSDLHIEIEYGNLFNENDIHAILRIGAIYQTLICVYYYNSSADSVQTLLYFDGYHSVYQADTIRDVNGDNKKDFILESYPMNSCCLSVLKDVYLFQTATKFSAQYHFVNPTFYPKEKIIRGLTYGGQEKALYKYEWNGLKIDTIEFIFPNLKDTTRKNFFKTKKIEDVYHMEKVNKTNLNSIPKEYHSIDNFDAFLRDLD